MWNTFHAPPLEEPIKTCEYCRKKFGRPMYANGKRQRRCDFKKRRFCSYRCAIQLRPWINRRRMELRKQQLLGLLLDQVPIKECARVMQINETTARVYAREPQFQKTLREEIERLGHQAIKKMERLIDSEHEGLALKACDSVLDRIPETARTGRVESDIRARFSIDPATLLHAAMTARELEAPVIEGEVSEQAASE